jgi:hypothetical protein
MLSVIWVSFSGYPAKVICYKCDAFWSDEAIRLTLHPSLEKTNIFFPLHCGTIVAAHHMFVYVVCFHCNFFVISPTHEMSELFDGRTKYIIQMF